MTGFIMWDIEIISQVDTEQPDEETRKRQRTGSQFSIDELLKHDDKRSKFEVDSKSTPFDEVEPEAGSSSSLLVKGEPSSPEPCPAPPNQCLSLMLGSQQINQTETLRTSSPSNLVTDMAKFLHPIHVKTLD